MNSASAFVFVRVWAIEPSILQRAEGTVAVLGSTVGTQH